MPSLDSIKPVAATVLTALYLPVPLYLLALHGLHPLWRRIGLRAYIPLLGAYALMVAAVIAAHPLWPTRAWGWPGWLSATAVLPAALAIILAVITYRGIEAGTLHLARQIDPSQGRPLITTGILGTIRHPRYLMFTLIAVTNFMLTGYPLAAISTVACALLFTWVIRLEERELLAHFGDAFRDYQRRVPAFIPRPGRRRRATP